MPDHKDMVASMVAGLSTDPATAEILIKRLCEACDVKTTTALADVLGISQASISKAKTKGKIPPDWFITISYKTGFSVDWLLYGEGAKINLGNEEDGKSDAKASSVANTIPVVALGPSSLKNWAIKISTSFKVLHKDIEDGIDADLVVMSPGSPILAGASHSSSLLFCNTGQTPEDGHLAYIERIDNLAIIGQYWPSEDGKVVSLDVTKPASATAPEESVEIDVNREMIKRVAAVVYVKEGL